MREARQKPSAESIVRGDRSLRTTLRQALLSWGLQSMVSRFLRRMLPDPPLWAWGSAKGCAESNGALFATSLWPGWSLYLPQASWPRGPTGCLPVSEMNSTIGGVIGFAWLQSMGIAGLAGSPASAADDPTTAAEDLLQEACLRLTRSQGPWHRGYLFATIRLEIPRGTVLSLIHRARQKLKKRLGVESPPGVRHE